MSENEPKWFLKSKTVIGAIMAILPTLLPVFGVSFSTEEVGLVNGAVDATITAGGALLAVYGRFTAKESVTVLPK
ncbi:MAG: hypothetical protein CMF31_05000 [Kordiimonas sp.]|nr:hypothetical protein [Kordiimonas sp.]